MDAKPYNEANTCIPHAKLIVNFLQRYHSLDTINVNTIWIENSLSSFFVAVYDTYHKFITHIFLAVRLFDCLFMLLHSTCS